MDYQKLVEDIKDRLDIVDVVSEYVELKKSGNRFKGLCPFHSEKTPSFTVSTQRQIFHCFGCNTGGDMVAFIMKHEGMGFVEALLLLAGKAGIEVDALRGGADRSEAAKKTIALLKVATDFYRHALMKSPRGLSYLKGRGLDEETMERFSLGYAPEGWEGLCTHLKKAGFSQEDMLAAGVAAQGAKGVYDFLRGRVVFPIINAHGDAIAFGGRIIGEGEPKYLNTPETALFKKKRTLFGFNLAREEIGKKGLAIVVEGYLDVITCHSHGISNVCAPLGTALTEEHARVLKRQADRIIVVFDGDQAGINAAKRALEALLKESVPARALILPDKKDPDSFLRTEGPQEFLRRLEESRDFIDFMIQSEGRDLDNLRRIYQAIGNVRDLVLKSKLVTDLAQRASLSESVLREMDSPRPAGRPVARSIARSIERRAVRRPVKRGLTPETVFLAVLLGFPGAAGILRERVKVEDLEDPLAQKVFAALLCAGEPPPTIHTLTSLCSEEEISRLTAIAAEPFITEDEVDKNIADCIRTLRLKKMERSLAEIAAEMESATDPEHQRALMKRHLELINEKKTI